MISEEYEFNVCFLFAIFWSFGFTIEEKRIEEVIRQVFVGDEQLQKTKFQKISQLDHISLLPKHLTAKIRGLEEAMNQLTKESFANRLISLAELIPLKKGKFVSSMEIGGMIGSFQDVKLVGSQVVNMRSNFIANLALIRQHFRTPIAIEGRDWLTTVLNTSNPQPPATTRSYNFHNHSPMKVFEELFRGSKRSGTSYSFPGSMFIVVDDVHLANSYTLNCLTDLSEYGFAMFLEDGEVCVYQISKCQFTFGGKSSYPTF